MAKKAGSEKIDSTLEGVPLRAGPPPKRSAKAGASGVGAERAGAGDKDGPQRLQRVLASAGFGSRRQCEELTTEGRVEVDGKTVIELGTQVDPKTAKIYVDGNLLKKQRLVYFLLNKPPGVVTSNKDPQGRTRVIDLIQEPERIFPVGRLDRSSEGLLLLTNDGDLAQQLAHPKFGVRKIYRVTVAGKVDSEKLVQMKKGIYIAEGHVAVDGAKILRHRGKSTDLEVVLREGKNREIRRILARLGHKVMTLQRVAIGPLRLGELPRGMYRPLKSDELRRLREEVFYQSRAAKTVEDAGEGKPRNPKKKGGGKRSVSSRARSEGANSGGVRSEGAKEGRVARAAKSTDRKPPVAKKRVLARKAGGRKSASESLDIGLEGSNRVGTVIGDDVVPREVEREKRVAKKKGAGQGRLVAKRSSRSAVKGAAGKQSGGRLGSKKRSPKKRSGG